MSKYKIHISGDTKKFPEYKTEIRFDSESEVMAISSLSQALIITSMQLGIPKKEFFKNLKNHYEAVEEKYDELTNNKGENK